MLDGCFDKLVTFGQENNVTLDTLIRDKFLEISNILLDERGLDQGADSGITYSPAPPKLNAHKGTKPTPSPRMPSQGFEPTIAPMDQMDDDNNNDISDRHQVHTMPFNFRVALTFNINLISRTNPQQMEKANT